MNHIFIIYRQHAGRAAEGPLSHMTHTAAVRCGADGARHRCGGLNMNRASTLSIIEDNTPVSPPPGRCAT